MIRDLAAAHVRVGVARATPVVAAELERIGLGAVLGPDSFFPTVDAAVQALVGARGSRASRGRHCHRVVGGRPVAGAGARLEFA